MTTQTMNGGSASADQDIIAVRALMAQDVSTEASKGKVVGQTSELPELSVGEQQAEPVRTRKSPIRPRHVAVVALAVFAVFRPVLMLQAIALLISPIILFMIYLSFVGIDGFWRRTRSLYLRIKARNPAFARRLRKGFYQGAGVWDATMDRMPGRMPEAVYVPDFQAQAAAEAAHERALDQRFASLRDEMSA